MALASQLYLTASHLASRVLISASVKWRRFQRTVVRLKETLYILRKKKHIQRKTSPVDSSKIESK